MNESLLMLINVATTNTAIANPSTLPEAIEYHTLTTHMRTIPRKFVRQHQVHAYSRAILHFGHLQFRVLFRIKQDQDRREIDDDTRLHMITNWQAFLDENGLPEEKVLRLELHEEKFVLGENVHFELSTSKYVEVQLGCRLNSRPVYVFQHHLL